MQSSDITRTRVFAFFEKNCPFDLMEQYGSPLYVYNERILRKCCRELKGLSSYPNFKVCYSAKANENLSLLKIIKEEGLGVDAMSPGEVIIEQKAGFKKEEITYVCNNVSQEELKFAYENAALVSVDSLSLLEAFGQTTKSNAPRKVMVRVNPGIGAGHSQKVITAGKETKFGINPEDFDQVFSICEKYNLQLAGINQHIGSLFLEPDTFLSSVEWLLDFVKDIPDLEVIDFGGGFGIPYQKEARQSRLDMKLLGTKFHQIITTWADKNNYQGSFTIEPGRYVVAECGYLLGSVYATKQNHSTRYIGTDLGFNVLQRPVMYDSHHDVVLIQGDKAERSVLTQTIVGNICESGDIMAKERALPVAEIGDIICVLDAGAYGYAMASSYNVRLKPAEILIKENGTVHLIRRAETMADILSFFEV